MHEIQADLSTLSIFLTVILLPVSPLNHLSKLGMRFELKTSFEHPIRFLEKFKRNICLYFEISYLILQLIT